MGAMTDQSLLTLSNRAVIALGGSDVRDFLQGILTQDLASIDAAGSGAAALLTPQGKVLSDFLIASHDGGYLIDCDSATRDALQKRISMYKLRADVTVQHRDDLGVAVHLHTDHDVASYAVVFDDPRLQSLGRRIIAPFADLPETNETAGPAYDAHRIALGVPQFGKDYGADEIFLLDVNADALNIVDYKKGCFVGQEVTSRMKRKGEVRKRTLSATYDGEDPVKGAPVLAGESALGEILAANGGAALALIRLDRWRKATEAGHGATCNGAPLQLSIPQFLQTA